MRVLLLVLAASLPVAAQAPYLSGDTGVAVGAEYARSTGGTDINAFAVDAIVTLSPRIDLSASASSSGQSGRSKATSVGVGSTAYLIAGPDVWVGGSARVSYIRVPSGGADGVQLSAGVVAARAWMVGSVRVVPRMEANIVGPVAGSFDDPFVTVAASVGVQLPVSGRSSIVVEPSAGYAFRDDTPTGNGLLAVGATLRLVVSR